MTWSRCSSPKTDERLLAQEETWRARASCRTAMISGAKSGAERRPDKVSARPRTLLLSIAFHRVQPRWDRKMAVTSQFSNLRDLRR